VSRRVSALAALAPGFALGSLLSCAVISSSAPPSGARRSSVVANGAPLAPAVDVGGPSFTRTRLENGLGIRVFGRHSLPLVELRLVLRSGSGTDRDAPGAALMTGKLLREGAGRSDLLDRAEALGSSLQVSTTRDATILSLSVASHQLDEAMAVLAAVIARAEFDDKSFERAQQREIERVSLLARMDDDWALSMVLSAELFRAGAKRHPYARFDVTARELSRLELSDCRAWLAENSSPRNAFVVAAGDVELARVEQAARAAFAQWSGREVAPPIFFPPRRPDKLKVLLLDRRDGALSELRLMLLGPERQSASWAATEVAAQVLGGGTRSRLARGLLDRRVLVHESRAETLSLAYGQSTLALTTVTSAEQAVVALPALLEHLDGAFSKPPGVEELESASARLSAALLVAADASTSIADLGVDLGVFDLPDDHFEAYSRDLAGANAEKVQAAARASFQGVPIAAVAGDARLLVTPLSRFGQVQVIDPERNFEVQRVVSHDPTAPLEPRRAPTQPR
jgi:zinc protease